MVLSRKQKELGSASLMGDLCSLCRRARPAAAVGRISGSTAAGSRQLRRPGFAPFCRIHLRVRGGTAARRPSACRKYRRPQTRAGGAVRGSVNPAGKRLSRVPSTTGKCASDPAAGSAARPYSRASAGTRWPTASGSRSERQAFFFHSVSRLEMLFFSLSISPVFAITEGWR